MRISDWSSDVCSSDLVSRAQLRPPPGRRPRGGDLPRRAQERDRGSDADFDRFVRKNQCSCESRSPGLQALLLVTLDSCFRRNTQDRKSTRLNSSHSCAYRMTYSAFIQKTKTQT